MTAYDYWKKRFGEPPNNTSERLACAMMTEYGREQYNQVIDEMAVKLKDYGINTEWVIGRIKEMKR